MSSSTPAPHQREDAPADQAPDADKIIYVSGPADPGFGELLSPMGFGGSVPVGAGSVSGWRHAIAEGSSLMVLVNQAPFTHGQQSIDLTGLPDEAEHLRAVAQMAAVRVGELHASETAATRELTEALERVADHLPFKDSSLRADAPSMVDPEPAPERSAPIAASIPLTTKALVAKREKIRAKAQAKLDAVRRSA